MKLMDKEPVLINAEIWGEVLQMIAACSGVFVEAVAGKQMSVSGDSLKVSFNVVNRNKSPLRKVKLFFYDTSFVVSDSLPSNQVKTISFNWL